MLGSCSPIGWLGTCQPPPWGLWTADPIIWYCTMKSAQALLKRADLEGVLLVALLLLAFALI